MREDLTQKLFEAYPELYRGRTEGCQYNLMCFGFECGDGWFELLMDLSKRIDEIAKKHNQIGEHYPKAFQVKSKFGGLRFYMEPLSGTAFEEINEAIGEIEIQAYKTCEQCGRSGSIRNDLYWIAVLCDEHYKHYKNDNKN